MTQENNSGGGYTVEYLHQFIKEWIRAGLFKNNIIEKLEDLGVDRGLAIQLVDEMERKLHWQSRKRKILIVEDEPHSRMLLVEILKLAGYKIAQAADGQEALDQLRDVDPDLIITDALMPNVNGHELIRELKETVLWRDVPVIAISARGKMEDLFESLKVVKFLKKPYSTDDLLDAVRSVLPSQA